MFKTMYILTVGVFFNSLLQQEINIVYFSWSRVNVSARSSILKSNMTNITVPKCILFLKHNLHSYSYIELTQIKSETQQFNILCIILFHIEFAEAQSL